VRKATGARLYLVTAPELAAGKLSDLVAGLAAAGVDLIQLRAKDMEAGDLLRVGEPVAAACRAAGVPLVVNDRPDVALALGADGVHLGQNDLPVWVARRILGAGLVGRSTHARAEIDAESNAEQPPDYIAVGPVYATPTKAGRPPVGLDLVRYAAARPTPPWFAIGGIDRSNLRAVLDAGARRIVVVRAIAQAPDPFAAAAELRALLDEVPLEEAS
jgi:thiamine-phosphate pyrophosphorylase